ncbi:glycosyltransferase [Acinetobacter thermotolerans]|uniref:glycosyltransferase family 8 protein n=1 Tax=Acinetobacter thermotolerans TaxID=3151487 RepID=UPI00325ACF2F
MSNIHGFVKESYTLGSQQDHFSPDINIAFAIDRNYLRPCGVTLFSITEHNKDLNIDFYIFTTFFDPFGYEEILKNNSNIRIHVYILNTQAYDNLQTNGHFTTAIYYRLSIANILQDKLNEILYLDADILCTSSIKEIKNLKFDNEVIAAVEEKWLSKDHLKSIDLPQSYQYFNSGVMLINIPLWNKINVIDQFNQHITKRSYKFPDQDVLNIILFNKVKYIHEKFNFFTQAPDVNPIFTHYLSSPKPWSIAATNNANYLIYYKKSPWGRIPLDLPKSRKEMRKYSSILWKDKKFAPSIKWFIKYLMTAK